MGRRRRRRGGEGGERKGRRVSGGRFGMCSRVAP